MARVGGAAMGSTEIDSRVMKQRATAGTKLNNYRCDVEEGCLRARVSHQALEWEKSPPLNSTCHAPSRDESDLDRPLRSRGSLDCVTNLKTLKDLVQ